MARRVKMALNAVNKLRQHPALFLCLFILMYTIVFSYIAILKNDAFSSTAWDLGIYEQVIWSTTNTGRLFWYTPEVLINPSCNFLGIHFSPILFIVVPIYAVYQSTETLLVLQASVIALAAIPLYKLALLESKSARQALALSLIYLAYPPIASMNVNDFHVQAFLPLFLFFAFYYFRKEEWAKYFLFIVLASMVMEIVPLIVVFFGFYGLWVNRKKLSQARGAFHLNRLLTNKSVTYSVATIALGAAWFVLARTVTSAINPTAQPNPNWASFGDPIHNLPGLLFNVLVNPLKTINAIVTPVDPKAIFLFGLFAPLAFLSFLSPPSLLIGAPWFLIAFLSNYSPYYSALGHQYVAFVAPFIFVSAIYGVKRLSAVKDYFASSERFARVHNKIAKIRYGRTIMIICLVLVISFSYFAVLDIHVSLPVVTEHDHVLEVFVGLIPSNASVLTQNDLLPHLSRRLYVYAPLPTPTGNLSSDIAFDYIFVDTTSGWYVDSLKQLVDNLTDPQNRTFGIQYSSDGVLLLKKGYTGPTINPFEDYLISLHYQGIVMQTRIKQPAKTVSMKWAR
jgi:uncharacterized membrane protein